MEKLVEREIKMVIQGLPKKFIFMSCYLLVLTKYSFEINGCNLLTQLIIFRRQQNDVNLLFQCYNLASTLVSFILKN